MIKIDAYRRKTYNNSNDKRTTSNLVPVRKGRNNVPKSRVICLEALRDVFKEHMAPIFEVKEFLNLTEYLVFRPEYCSKSYVIRKWGQPQISVASHILARECGKLRQNLSNNFNAGAFLRSYRDEVLPDFEWRWWNHKEGCPRTVVRLGLPDEIEEALAEERERQTLEGDNLVFFGSGKRLTARRRRRLREADKQRALDATGGLQCATAEMIFHYLNELPPNRFTKALQHVPEARRYALGIDKATKRSAALGNLRAFEVQPQPFYKPSHRGKTVRLFHSAQGLLGMPSEMRTIVAQDWQECDLSCAQLAIASKLWEVDALHDFLREGGDFWRHTYEHMQERGLTLTFAEFKPDLKEIIYSLVYGMVDRSLKRSITLRFRDSMPGDSRAANEAFWDAPFILELLKARERVAEEIRERGGREDCFGRFISTASITDKEKPKYSVLAQVNQSMEMDLVAPVFDLAQKTKEFDVTLFIHDGLYCAFKNASKQEGLMRQIREAVEDRIQAHDVPTTLEWK